jgi:hypothetical protein
MQVRPNDRGCVSTLLPFGSVSRLVSSNILNRSETMRSITVVVGGEVSPGEIPVILRAPPFPPAPKLTVAERRTLLPII